MKPLQRSALRWMAPALIVALASPAWSADGSLTDALRAADPSTPSTSAPLALPDPQRLDMPDLPADLERAREIWREANRRVAEFPRGHVDLLRWEATTKPPTTGASAARPAAAEPLGLAEALRLSLRERPDLFTHPDMNALDRQRVNLAYADHVRELQHAWIDAVAMRERARLADAVLDASRTGSELGRRMVRAGNWPQARLMQEQLIEAGAWQARADAEVAARAAVLQLAGMLGIWHTEGMLALEQRLPQALPAPPTQVRPGEGLQASGIEAAVVNTDAALALEREAARRVFGALPSGRWDAWTRARDAALQALPDPGTAGMAPPHIDDLSLVREHRLREADEMRAKVVRMAGERRAGARAAWDQLRARHASAQHAEQVVGKLKDNLQQETLLRYNGMLESTWQLLGRARERTAALDASLVARRDFWRAQATWQSVLAGAAFKPEAASATPGTAGESDAGGH